MSYYKSDKKTINKIANLGVGDDVLYQEVESLIQSLKNNQRCYAEAASLVNSSELRNFFERIELERTVFMQRIAKSINRLDLVTGTSGHGADVVWFASIEVNGMSMVEFDKGILARCIRCEEAIHQAYISAIDAQSNNEKFMFLNDQQTILIRSRKQLSALDLKFSN